MSPGLVEVGGEVGVEFITAESLMGAENLTSGGSHGDLVHLEVTAWSWVLILTSAVLVNGIVVDH